jgi:hypothetical protein
VKKLITVVILLASLTSCASVGPRHNILGTTYGWDAGEIIDILLDAQVGQLRIRHVRMKDKDCDSGYEDHLELFGPIGPDSTAAIERIIPTMHQCMQGTTSFSRSIYMSSGGGLMSDGFELGKILRENQMTSRIVGGQSCASSCAIAFLGGRYRYITQDGRILFHAPYRAGRYSIDCSDRGQVRALRNYYEDQLGESDGEFLLDRTMSYCSSTDGWTLNADGASLFNITTR